MAADGSAPRLRAGAIGDLVVVRELARQAFALYGDYDRLLPEWMGVPGVELVLAEQDGQTIGLSMLAALKKPGSAEWVADLLAIAVDERFRGQGVGRRLLQAAVVRARELALQRGVSAMELTVAEGNALGRRLFESEGFHYLARDKGRYPHGQRALRMRLELKP